jgi:hypothetical protein
MCLPLGFLELCWENIDPGVSPENLVKRSRPLRVVNGPDNLEFVTESPRCIEEVKKIPFGDVRLMNDRQRFMGRKRTEEHAPIIRCHGMGLVADPVADGG